MLLTAQTPRRFDLEKQETQPPLTVNYLLCFVHLKNKGKKTLSQIYNLHLILQNVTHTRHVVDNISASQNHTSPSKTIAKLSLHAEIYITHENNNNNIDRFGEYVTKPPFSLTNTKKQIHQTQEDLLLY